MSQVIQSLDQQHYFSKLVGYDYEIQYKPGNMNVVVNALSRSQCLTSASCLILIVPQFVFLDEVKKKLQSDSSYIAMLDKYNINPSPY